MSTSSVVSCWLSSGHIFAQLSHHTPRRIPALQDGKSTQVRKLALGYEDRTLIETHHSLGFILFVLVRYRNQYCLQEHLITYSVDT